MTGVGFVPVAYAAEEDGLIAAWTNKENLILADREILLQPQEGTLGEDTQVRLPEVKSSRYQKNDIVTVIVELEDAPLLACANEAGLELQTYGATGQGIAQAQALEDSPRFREGKDSCPPRKCRYSVRQRSVQLRI